MDTSLFKYQMFLAEQLEEQAKYEACLNEAILISENKLDEIHLVHEGFVDKVKSTIMKIMEGLKKLWAKFIEAMDTLIKKDKAYLDKYKQTILKKTPVEATYTMYKYDIGVKNLLNSPIPVFNYNSMKDSLESEEAFIAKSFSKFKPSENVSFVDKVKAELRGSAEQVEVPSRQLNMTDMFNYCYTYDKIKDLINKDLGYVEKAAQDAINIVDKMAREKKINTESYNLFEDNKYYSLMYESYIHEEEKATGNKKPGTEKVGNGMQREVKGGDGTAPGGTKPSEAYKGVNGDKDNSKMKEEDVEMIVLPGGLPGATNLDAHAGLDRLIRSFAEAGKPLAAICAAPMVYGKRGLLKGKKATCYPGFDSYLEGAEYTGNMVETADNFILGKGPGAASAFGFAILEKFAGAAKVQEVKSGMLMA